MSTIINKSIIAIAIALAGPVTPKTTVGGAQSTIIPSTPRAPSRVHAPLQVLSASLPMPTTPIRRNVHSKVELELALGDAFELSPVQPRKLNFEAVVGPRPVLSASRLARLAPRHWGADFVIDEILPETVKVPVTPKNTLSKVPVTPKNTLSKVPVTPRAPSRVLASISSQVPTTPIRRGAAPELGVAFDLTPIQPRKLDFASLVASRPVLSASRLARLAPRHSGAEFVIDEILPKKESETVKVPVTPKNTLSKVPVTPRAPSRVLASISSQIPTTPIRRNVRLDFESAIDLSPVQPLKINFEAIVAARPALSAARARCLAPLYSWTDVIDEEIEPESQSKSVKVELPVTPKSKVSKIPTTPRAPSRVLASSSEVPTTPIRRNVRLDLESAIDLSPVQPCKLDFEAIAGPPPAFLAARLHRLAPRHSWAEVVIEEVKPKSKSVKVPVTPKSKVGMCPVTPRAPSRVRVARSAMSPCTPTRASPCGRRAPRDSTDSVDFGDIKPLDFGTVLVRPVLSPARLQRLIPRDSWGSVVIDEIVSCRA